MARRTFWRRYRGWIALGILAAIGIAVFFFWKSSQQTEASTSYTTQAAEAGTLSVTVSGTGNLAVRDEVEVWPDISGEIAKVSVAVGDSVSKGDTLYTLDADSAEANTEKALSAKRQAEESLARANLSLTQARNSLANMTRQSSSPSSTVSSADIKAAQQQVAVAKAGVSSAKASLATANTEYATAVDAEDDLTVQAPCDGVVWQVNIEAGDPVSTGATSSGSSGGTGTSGSTGTSSGTGSTGSAPVTVARKGLMAVDLSINEVDVTTLEVGQPAELTFDAVPDLTITGKVDTISDDGTVSQGVVTYDVWVTLDVNDARLKPGMSATASIVTAVARNVLLVPNAAIKTSDQGSYVQVLPAGSTTPQNVAVTTGLEGTSQTVIESGITTGTLVVTKTTTSGSDTTEGSSASAQQGGDEGGFMMMGTGGPPAGGPGGQ